MADVPLSKREKASRNSGLVSVAAGGDHSEIDLFTDPQFALFALVISLGERRTYATHLGSTNLAHRASRSH